MIPRILFLISGLGLGNSTRCHAVIQRLKASGACIRVVTSGNGLWYFSGRDEIDGVHPIEPLYYAKKNGKLSVAGTLASIAHLRKIISDNNLLVADVLREFKPHAIVADSHYGFANAKHLGILRVALNNSDLVVTNFLRLGGGRALTVQPQLVSIEVPDYLYHNLVPDLVISPILDPEFSFSRSSRFRHVGPIVRTGYEPDQPRQEVRRIAIMLSGSAFGSQVDLRKWRYPISVDVVGREAPPDWEPKPEITWHGKIKDTLSILKGADLVVINGGFSAVSEAFYMRKPLVVVPVPRHAEQWVNAKMIEALGVGMSADEDSIELAIHSALRRIHEFRTAYSMIGEVPDGAAQSASCILAAVEKR